MFHKVILSFSNSQHPCTTQSHAAVMLLENISLALALLQRGRDGVDPIIFEERLCNKERATAMSCVDVSVMHATAMLRGTFCTCVTQCRPVCPAREEYNVKSGPDDSGQRHFKQQRCSYLDVVGVGEEHGQSVNPHAPASCWRQAVLQSSAEVLVH